MNNREEDSLHPVDLDQAYDQPVNESNLQQTMVQIQDKAAEKFDDINQIANYQMRVMQEKIGFKGDRTQVYQQTALLMSVVQTIIATYLSMLISQTAFLGHAWTFIPIMKYFFILIYFVCIIMIQCFPENAQQTRYNFAFGCAHAFSKVVLIVYASILLFDIRVEVFLVSLVAVQGYIAFKIYVPTQKQEEFDLKFKDLWRKMTLFQFCVSFFLMYFTRSNYGLGLLIFCSTLLIGFYTILCLQRFREHLYFQFNSNDLYLGALQLEGDMLLPCGLIAFLKQNKSRTPSITVQSPSSIKEIQKEQSEQRMAVQSVKSVAEI